MAGSVNKVIIVADYSAGMSLPVWPHPPASPRAGAIKKSKGIDHDWNS
jgi:hypothetical protein